MTLHSPSSDTFTGMWAALLEPLIVGWLPSAHKEAMAATVPIFRPHETREAQSDDDGVNGS